MLVDQRTWLHKGCCCSSGCHTQIHTHTHWRGGGTESTRSAQISLPHSRPPLSGSLMALTSHYTHTHTHLAPTYCTPHPLFNTKSEPSCTHIKPLQLNQIASAHPLFFFSSRFPNGNRSRSGTRYDAPTSHCATSVSQSRRRCTSHEKNCASHFLNTLSALFLILCCWFSGVHFLACLL